MAVLQAARAYTLGLPLESAYSWGLNRAIFIAAAKRGFKAGSGSGREPANGKGTPRQAETFHLGDDMAFKTERKGVLLFKIGGEVQDQEAFDRQVKARFGRTFKASWEEGLAHVKSFDKETLLSTEDFFRTVYRPVRDDLAEKWTEASQAGET
jgi:hypothetical protein